MLKSPVADMKNIGGRWGGALTAGLFLKEFVANGVPWVHLDIAGPAFRDSDHPFWGRGGTGAGVATLVEVVRGLERRALSSDEVPPGRSGAGRGRGGGGRGRRRRRRASVR
jgi:leucyl aminopeptidase